MADNNLNYEPVTTEPISEIGKELYALLGNEVELEEPISEIGKILYAMLGYEVEIPEPKSVIARLLYQYYLEGGGDIPEELITEMNAVLNKKLGTSTTYLPNTWADNVNLLGKLPTKTASGSIANFVDGADDVPIAEGVFNIVATQAGTGDPSPSNVRPISGFTGCNIVKAGKNLVVINAEKESRVNGTFTRTYSANNTVTFENTSVGSFYVIYGLIYISDFLVGQTFRLSAGQSSTSGNKIVFASGTTSTFSSYDDLRTQTYTILASDVGKYLGVFIFNASGTPITYSNIQVEVGSTATGYETPVSNIYNIDWTTEAGTVYGGSLNLTTGVLTINRAIKALTANDNAWTYANGVFYSASIYPVTYQDRYNVIFCSCYKPVYVTTSAEMNNNEIRCYANRLYIKDSRFTDIQSFIAGVAGQMVCYQLTTPITYQLSPVEIRTILGVNNIWTDTNGDSAIQYRADIDLIINS